MKLASTPIHLTRCAKTYAGKRVLDPFDLQIAAAETLVLLGPSGCGKSTTLRLIAGLEMPDAGGTIRFGGLDVTRLPIERRQVGMVFQHYALFPHLNVRDNIGYGLRIRKIDAAARRRRVDQLLAMTRLEAQAEQRIDHLSGGQKQRVALARALAVEPRVLLLDEPLTALDARLRDTLRRDMQALLRGLGVTCVYVTHDQTEAMALGDRIAVMSAGRIEQIGTPREIYYRPANRRVAQFVGTLNRLDGMWLEGRFTTSGGSLAYPRAVGELFFRPEDARLADPAKAALRGLVTHCTFLGERTRLTIEKAAPEAVQIDVPGRLELAPGTLIGLAIAPDGLLALP